MRTNYSSYLFLACMFSTLFPGCQTVFDPRPFRPTAAKEFQRSDSAIDSTKTPDTSYMLQFEGLDDAANKMQKLSEAYADQRDTMMCQQLVFDVPIMGLAAAAIASGIYGGSKDLILGLGLGSAAVAGGRAYFGPQGKIAAYNEASSSLGCGSHFARGITKSLHLTEGCTTFVTLQSLLKQAQNKLSVVANADLLAARDKGLKASTDLSVALGLISNASVQLESFAYSVVSSTTNKIVTGTQNLDTALTLINAAPTQLPPTAKKTASLTSVSEQSDCQVKVETGLDIGDIILELNYWSPKADTFAKFAQDKWSELLKCALPKS